MFNFDTFPGHEKDEKIIFSLRKHTIILLKPVLAFVILGLVPVLFFFVFSNVNTEAFSGPISYPMAVIGATVYYLGILAFIFNAFIDYYLDNWIITNHRVISIEQKNLFSRVVSEQALYRVQDVTAEAKGAFATLFGYGTVYVQSAGEIERFIFTEVPNAFEIAAKIQQLVLEDKQNHPGIPGD